MPTGWPSSTGVRRHQQEQRATSDPRRSGHEDGVRRLPHALLAGGEFHSPVAPRPYVVCIGSDLDDFIHGVPILK